MNEPAPLKSVLVVGGCGFLGHHIVHAVFNTYEQGLKVSVLDLYTTKNRHPDATYYTGDITSPSQVQRILSIVKPIVIVHTASPTAMSTKPSARTMFYKVNVEGTRNLLECAHAIGNVKAFIYTSSSSVVHNQRDSLVQATENMPVLTTPDQQPEYYSQTKAIAENMVTSANRNQGSEMLTASIRPAMMFGPGCLQITTNLIKRALSGGAKIQFGYGENLVDTCYVENCAYAHILAAKALVKASGYPALPAIRKVEGEVFFVTDDKPIPFWTFSRLAARTMGVPVKDEELQMIPRWFIMIVAFLLEWAYWIFTAGTKAPVLRMYAVRITTMERTVCIDKIKERLGYVPQVTTEDGMKRAVEWYFKVDREGTHIEKSKEV